MVTASISEAHCLYLLLVLPFGEDPCEVTCYEARRWVPICYNSIMEALILEETHKLRLGEIALNEPLGPRDVRIDIKTVGICGSDIHYYQHGRIGPFIVDAPMVLGHEASGIVTEVGGAVSEFKPGDRVCMEPGIPDPSSRASRLGMYNLDPAVRFWATPPVHGILRPSVVHPADYTFKLPGNVSFAEAAMVEPLAVGMQAAKKAKIEPGDLAVVMGAGPIGMVTALAALAGGCSRVILTDTEQPKIRLRQHARRDHAGQCGSGKSRGSRPSNDRRLGRGHCV